MLNQAAQGQIRSLSAVTVSMTAVLLAKRNGDLLANEPAKELLLLAFREGLELFRAKGILSAQDCLSAEKFLWEAAQRGGGFRASGFKAANALLSEAKKFHISCPTLEKLFAMVSQYRK